MKITMFYGQECPHCHVMEHIVDKLVGEGKDIEKLEVWHNEENAKEMRKCSEPIMKACQGDLGVPVFLDKDKNRAICGELSYERLKEWISKG
jgi:glutaredoxin